MKWSSWWYYEECLLFCLGVTSLLPTLWGTFVFDDGEAILNNEDVTQKSFHVEFHKRGVLELFKNDFWGSRITHPNSHKSYRPLTTLTYRWDYSIWGQNPFPFHLLNWIIHGTNCILVLHFLRHCYTKVDGSGRIKLPRKVEEIILWASVLFSVHPVHVEPLGGLVGRSDLLAAMVFLVGFIVTSSMKSGLGQFVFLPVIAIFGSLFKENAITLVILFLSLKIFRQRSLRLSPKDTINFGTTLLITLSFLAWRLWFQGGPPVFQHFDNPPAFAESYFSKIFSIMYVWVFNVFILINPTWLSFDWSMGCINLIQTPLDPRFVLVVLLIPIGIQFVRVAFNYRTVLIGLLIAATTFLPSSNLVFTVGFVIAERNLYLPSIGFSLVLSFCFLKIPRSKPFLIFVVIIFFGRSFQRSFDWINQDRLFLSAMEVCPNNAKVHYNIGTMYGESGNTELAIQSYKRAIELKHDYYQAMNNLANILRATNKLDRAECWLRKAVHFREDFAAAWMNLGIVLSRKNTTEALECYRNALKLRNFYPDCEYNLGNLYLDMGEKDLALKSWIRTTNLQPSHSQSWINIIILLEQENRLMEAKDWAHKALKFVGDSEDTLQFLLGNIYGRLDKYETAKEYFLKAIQICEVTLKSVPAKYWSNLGVLYHRWGKVSDARIFYTKALDIEPDMDSAKNNLERLLKLAKI